MGHEKTTMTYGLYAGVVPPPVKRGALTWLACGLPLWSGKQTPFA
jgi:hypothetical protein